MLQITYNPFISTKKLNDAQNLLKYLPKITRKLSNLLTDIQIHPQIPKFTYKHLNIYQNSLTSPKITSKSPK
jgi:hypothetical protein